MTDLMSRFEAAVEDVLGKHAGVVTGHRATDADLRLYKRTKAALLALVAEVVKDAELWRDTVKYLHVDPAGMKALFDIYREHDAARAKEEGRE